MLKKKLIIFYGGTFDPIHYGHLISIMSLAKLCKTPYIAILPNNIPPHKSRPIATTYQRLIMIRLAVKYIKNNFIIIIDNRELNKKTTSWTIETLKSIRDEYGYTISLGFAIGNDVFKKFDTWYKKNELHSLCHLLICNRNIVSDNYNKKLYNFKNIINPNILYQYPFGCIYYANTLKYFVSSSEIRKRYKIGLSCDKLLPPEVQEYIYKQKLYK